ncbi:hypothetical protein K1T71_007877 [Dendrolimus kikuchii]|uniref:Uncharacterized protein n=1 Tax=Dendrolimus kikuchii TaxID=765133 RepID=A0ACC1CZE1_9NEOP|nr:hypothetical protein K1T71_007877 [Dendrolimus kikuchii]
MPKVVKSADREMILKVKGFCEPEYKKHGVLISINNIRKRVATMTDNFGAAIYRFCPLTSYRLEYSVSEKTVTRVTKEGATAASTSKVIITPGKSRPHTKKLDLDEFDLCAIRQKIHSFYVARKELPTLAKLRAALKEDKFSRKHHNIAPYIAKYRFQV